MTENLCDLKINEIELEEEIAVMTLALGKRGC